LAAYVHDQHLSEESSMQQWRKSLSSTCVSALGLAIVGCGSGGGSPPIAIEKPSSLNDARLAIKVAANLIEMGPYGINESLIRANPSSDWLTKTSTSTGSFGGARNTIQINNDDGIPSVGDSKLDSFENATFAYGSTSGVRGSFSANSKLTVTSISNPASPDNEAWTSGYEWNSATKANFAGITVAGKYSFDQNNSGTNVFRVASTQNADNTQADATFIEANGSETSQLGDSRVKVNGQYVCRYGPNPSASAICGDVSATMVGTVYGVAVNAKLTQISATPVVFQIEDGSIKYTVELTGYTAAVTGRTYSLKTPGGETLKLTGEDTNWLRIGF
jgi:hypothetical protein